MKIKSVLTFLAILAVLRCVWLAFQGVAPADAYEWLCAARLSAAYFDGPPGTAFLLKIVGGLAGDSLQIARFVWPLMGFVAAALAWLLASRIYDGVVATWVVIGLNALPVFNENAVAVSPLMPTLVLLLAGMLAAHTAWNGMSGAWFVAAVFFALAALFRYEAVLVPLGLVVAILLSEEQRESGWIGALALMALPLITLWRPLAWNAALEWVPLAGGTFRTFWLPNPSTWLEALWRFGKNFSPAIALLLMGGFLVQTLTSWGSSKNVFPLFLALFPVGWTLYSFATGRDFLAASWIACVPILLFTAAHWIRDRAMPLVGSILILQGLVFSGIGLYHSGLMRSGWAVLASQIHEASGSMPPSQGGGFLIADNKDLASVLSIYFKSVGQTAYPPVFVPESPAITSQFGIWPSYADFIESDKPADEYFTEQKGYNPFIGRNALFIGSDLPQTIKGAFSEVKSLRKISLPDGSEIIIFLCLGYQTLPL